MSAAQFVAHKIVVFVVLLAVLFYLRCRATPMIWRARREKDGQKIILVAEFILYLSLATSWIQKVQGTDGHLGSLITIAGATFLVLMPVRCNNLSMRSFQLTLIVMTLTGPSSVGSAIITMTQFDNIADTGKTAEVNALVVAALFKFATRHIFFATGHACSFNMLQYR